MSLFLPRTGQNGTHLTHSSGRNYDAEIYPLQFLHKNTQTCKTQLPIQVVNVITASKISATHHHQNSKHDKRVSLWHMYKKTPQNLHTLKLLT